MDKNKFLSELKKRMDGAIASLDHNLKGLRTGRASANLLDPVIVEAYNDKMQLSQVATISVPEARTITVQVWDKALVKPVEKAINSADLGVNAIADGQTIRVPIPPLTQERRNELIKVAHKRGEDSKIAIRNVRHDGMEQIKKIEKEESLAEDEVRNMNDEVQKITNEYVKKIETVVTTKEKEITTI